MNKSDLIEQFANLSKITKAEAKEHVQTVLDIMQDGIKDGGLELHGFGNFSLHTREPRTGRNPRTGESLAIAAKTSVKFSPWAGIKSAINFKP
jgi:nucleoid DNA-binding protein